MEVLLREDVEKLGKRGEVVDVAPGYARNFLLPRQLATKATQQNKMVLEQQRQQEERKQQEELQDLINLVRTIESTSVTVSAPASPEGHLFGSVGADMIAKAFQKDGFAVQPGMVKLAEPIKEVGVFTINIQVTGQNKAKSRVWVVAEG